MMVVDIAYYMRGARIMRIDAHQHYWRIARGDYGWITPDIPKLYRDFMPSDLHSHLAKHNIDGTIVVQAAPTYEETEFLLGLAENEPSILGVVGWIDLKDPDCMERFERMKSAPKFVGIRIMIQEMANAEEILDERYIRILRQLADQDTPIDLLLLSGQLDVAIRLLERIPNMRGVIDHLAKPRIAEGIADPWAAQIRAVAKHPGIYCKLSGMVTEADHRAWSPDHFTTYIRAAAEAFGPDRLLFGSDWPVCLLAAEYDQVVDVLMQALPSDWSDSDQSKLFGRNAKTFYKIFNGEDCR